MALRSLADPRANRLPCHTSAAGRLGFAHAFADSALHGALQIVPALGDHHQRGQVGAGLVVEFIGCIAGHECDYTYSTVCVVTHKVGGG